MWVALKFGCSSLLYKFIFWQVLSQICNFRQMKGKLCEEKNCRIDVLFVKRWACATAGRKT